jgi:hypothetical protein
LTIGQALTSFNDGVVVNSGTIEVGGAFELLNSSSLQNSGLITLAQGGDFKDQSKVTNAATGTIDVHGGTLNVMVDVGNAGHVAIDSGAKLNLTGATIDNGAVIGGGPPAPTGGALPVEHVSIVANTGGTITVNAGSGGLGVGTLTLDHGAVNGGTVNNQGIVNLTGSGVLQNGYLGNSGQINASGGGNALHKESVTANHALEVMANGALLMDLGTTVNNDGGTISIDHNATLTLDHAGIDKGTVTDAGTLNLNGNAVLKNGHLGNSGQINVSGSGNALDKESVTNTGTIDVSGALLVDQVSTIGNSGGTITIEGTGTLTLNQATINGGTINDQGTIDVTGDSKIQGTVSGSVTTDAVLNSGAVTIDASQVLTLDDVAVSGTTFTDTASGATIQVDDDNKLTLSGVAINGGTINDGTASG